MPSPQLSVRSARARDLAHELSRKEKRPIHAIVEDALNAYARAKPRETEAEFLKRVRAIDGLDDGAVDEMMGYIDEARKRPYKPVEF